MVNPGFVTEWYDHVKSMCNKHISITTLNAFSKFRRFFSYPQNPTVSRVYHRSNQCKLLITFKSKTKAHTALRIQCFYGYRLYNNKKICTWLQCQPWWNRSAAASPPSVRSFSQSCIMQQCVRKAAADSLCIDWYFFEMVTQLQQLISSVARRHICTTSPLSSTLPSFTANSRRNIKAQERNRVFSSSSDLSC